jgi:ABC-2 type transport system ATP-binding protein
MSIIETRSLSRNFKDNHAVQDLNLVVKRGGLFGLVGPDGAGKTTTLRLLAGLLRITSGSAMVTGLDLATQSELIKKRVGYMAQQFSLYGELNVDENLQFFSELYDVDPDIVSERKERLLVFAGLHAFRQRRAVHLSGGMQKKLALACTLIHQPEILLLDEPTTGVDPVSRREFWDILSDLHMRGTTILISTPYMDEADRCAQVGLMYNGRIIKCASPQDIRASINAQIVRLSSRDWLAAASLVEDLPGVFEVQNYGNTLHVLVDDSTRRIPEMQNSLDNRGIEIISIRPAPMQMEEAFISIINSLED